MTDASRRGFLRAIASAPVTASATAAGVGVLAGCAGPGDTVQGTAYPALDEWLTSTDVGDADDTYDGTVLDRRDADEIRVDVGVEGNHGDFAYGPSAVAVSPGTTVRWVWTGNGGGHTVDAVPEEQLGASDYGFSSGDPVAEAGHEFTQTFEEAGVALYHCDGVTGIHGAVSRPLSRGSRVRASFARAVDGDDHLGDGPDRSRLHYTPHLDLGMKGGVAVDE